MAVDSQVVEAFAKLRVTALNQTHRSHKAKMVDFAGGICRSNMRG